MKFVGSQLSYFLADRQQRRNVRALLSYVAFVAAVIAVFAVTFHFIMLAEGEEHSWITGLYWTLTVMSTLGFGDITFESDLGRAFSIVVLVSGIILLLVVLPFAFIRFFYAPWLEAQLRRRAPRAVPANTAGHVVVCAYDSIAPVLLRRLEGQGVKVVVLEGDPTTAANMHLDGVPVVTGELDARETFEALRLDAARMVLVNLTDTRNTTAILMIRAIAPELPIAALAAKDHSVDVLRLSGATHVLPLATQLGEQLARRVSAPDAHSYRVGHYEDLVIAELPLRDTPLVGATVRQTRVREQSGVSIVAVRDRDEPRPVRADTMLTEASIAVVIGTSEQLATLDRLLDRYELNPNPVLVIGGGRVGTAAIRELQRRHIPVHVVEQDPDLCRRLESRCKAVFRGDAADYDLFTEAGILDTPSVILTTADDATNVYLTSYCRKLNPDLRIVSRITHNRNLEAIHRAGADFVLSYATLGTEAVMSILEDKDLVVIGEQLMLFAVPVPPSLVGRTLAETGIGARTGLTVIALEVNGHGRTDLSADTCLDAGADLVMLGDPDQRALFEEQFGAPSRRRRGG